MKNLDCNDESLTEESVSTGTYTEKLTSAVTNTHMEESISAVIHMHIKESTSTATSTHTDSSTQPQHADHSESSGITDRADTQAEEIEEINISTHKGRTHNTIILIGVLTFSLLSILLVVLLLLLYLRRRSGMYKVYSAEIKAQNDKADSSTPAEGPPAL
jgi:hypothetical protein